MSKKTLGDEVRDENEHQRWLIENGKLYDATIERAQRAEAERDELQRAIMRLPLPPREMGDGPDERVTHALNEIDNLRAFVAAYDVWAVDGDVFGDPFDAMIEARAALDAKEQPK